MTGMILGIESSCDESAMALFCPKSGSMLSRVHSQLALHAEYGGVVPDLATREHLKRFPLLLNALREEPGWNEIQNVAVTMGPGLAGCLAIGISLAKAIALQLQCPLVGVNHLRAHAFSPFIDLFVQDPSHFLIEWKRLLPHLGLLVSGGNTLLFSIDEDGQIDVLAETADDAAGEALDKGAKLLGLPYPGGPQMEALAEQGDPVRHSFPRPFSDSNKMAYSFSGLKTSLRYRLEKMSSQEIEKEKKHLCASYQKAVMDSLLAKVRHAMDQSDFAFRSLGISGGVANNQLLRSTFTDLATKQGLPALIARPEYTGDNAAMIAFAAHVDPFGLITDDGHLGFEASLPIVR